MNKRCLVLRDVSNNSSGEVTLPSDYYAHSFVVFQFAYTPGGDKNYSYRMVPVELTKFSSKDLFCERIYGNNYNLFVELRFDRTNFKFIFNNVYKIYLLR